MTAVQPSVADTAYRLNARDMTIEAVYAKLVFLLCQGLAAEEIAHWMVTDIAGELSS